MSLKWVLAGATWNVNPGYNTCIGCVLQRFFAPKLLDRNRRNRNHLQCSFQLADSCMSPPGCKSLFFLLSDSQKRENPLKTSLTGSQQRQVVFLETMRCGVRAKNVGNKPVQNTCWRTCNAVRHNLEAVIEARCETGLPTLQQCKLLE